MGSANDMKAAAGTYAAFIRLIKIATPVIALITIVVVALISGGK